MPTTTFEVDAILFDMDGTLVDSTAGVLGAWQIFAETYPGIDVTQILSSAHGVRTVDNLKKYCGVEDPAELEREAQRFEEAIVTSASKDGKQGIVLLPGVSEIMTELSPAKHLPNPSWAICTSATRIYASAAVKIAGIPVPDVFVVAEDVTKGKPHPDPYLLGAQKCGVKPEKCLVFEDAPSGVCSGKAAGCRTIALLTTHSHDQMTACQPDFLVKDLTSISVKRLERGVQITVTTI